MDDVIECKRCNGSGEIAISIYSGVYIGAGPVPDDATGVCGVTCNTCRGMGYVEDIKPE